MGDLRWAIDGYEEWAQREDIPIHTGLAVDLMKVETAHWKRFDTNAAFVHLDARGDYCDLHLIELAPSGESAMQHHLYEAIAFVLDGNGSTVIEDPHGRTRHFEWKRGSLFAIPLNCRYQFLNATAASARIAITTNLPMVMKLYRNDSFVFGSDQQFPERWGRTGDFDGEGTFNGLREHRNFWETNLVPDLFAFSELRECNSRGTGSSHMHFVMADGTMHAHMSEIPPGNYKNAHHHDAGYHIIQLGDTGYSLYWNEGDEEPVRVDWSYGLAHSPSTGMWHQHFNVSAEPARYMAAALGSIRYPYTETKMKRFKGSSTVREFQIPYQEEDPQIRADFDVARQAFAGRSTR
jgi:mannose-6-phosphate isomerase-like protein (cupin superfamily)